MNLSDTIISLCWNIGIITSIIAGTMMFYSFAYNRGFQQGKHIGITKGLWLSAERKKLKVLN